MEVSNIFENECCQDIWSRDCLETESEWNGRKVDILTGDENSLLNRVTGHQMRIRPMMSKPDRAEATFSGGYDESRGGYVEGKVSMSWGDPNSSSDSKNKPSND